MLSKEYERLALEFLTRPIKHSPTDPMTFARWLSLSDAEREDEKRHWFPFEPGYWHTLAVEAAARFNAEFGSKPHVTKVFKSLYRARELIVAVQTDLPSPRNVDLPRSYLGFRVLQFASKVPAGVLVDPGPPSKVSPRARGAHGEPGSRIFPRETQHVKTETHHIVPLEGEIDFHLSAQIAAKLRTLIEDKPEKLVIDLSKVTYIDSSGLAVLINAMRRVEAYRGKLYLVGMQEALRIIFETLRLDQVFRIRRSAVDALKAT